MADPTQPTEEQIAVVDADNRFLYWSGRTAIHAQRLVHRSVYVLVFDRTGRMLIQLRHRDKQVFPLHWDISCAGHVCAEDYHAGPDEEVDLVYRNTGQRELFEELGITAPMEELAHMGPTDTHYEQTRIFRAYSDSFGQMQASELEQVGWITPEDFRAGLSDPSRKWTASLRRFGLWALEQGHWQALADAG